MEPAVHVQEEVAITQRPTAVKRFMETKEGWRFLNRVRRYLTGSTIVGVTFYPAAEGITTHVLLSDGQYFEFYGEMFSLASLREQFEPVFRRFAEPPKE